MSTVGYALLNGCQVEDVLLPCFGLLSGVFITPDHDLAESRWSIWQLYGKFFSHRGVSHWPVIGTLTRIAYLSPIPIAFFAYSHWHFPWPLFGKWLLWLCIADIVHVTLDIVVSRFKAIA